MHRMKARLGKIEKAMSVNQREKPIGFYDVPDKEREKILNAIRAAQVYCDHEGRGITPRNEEAFLSIYRHFYDEQVSSFGDAHG